MKLHNSVITRMTQLFDVWGGHKNQQRLSQELNKLDFSVYTNQTGEQILVLSSDLKNELKKLGG